MPSNQEVPQGGDNAFSAWLGRQRGGAGSHWTLLQSGCGMGSPGCTLGRSAVKYKVFLLSLLKCILSFFGMQLPWAEHNLNNLWSIAVISASLLRHGSGMVWRDGNHKSGLPHLEWIFSIFVPVLQKWCEMIRTVLVDDVCQVSFQLFSLWKACFVFWLGWNNYPSRGTKKVTEFYNPLANLLRSVEFSYLSPLSWPYRKYVCLTLIMISLRVGDTH